MTVAVLGDARPLAKTQWPLALSCSLKTSIAAISSALANSLPSARTEIRYCAIRSSPVVVWPPPGAPFHLYYERRCLDPTSTAEISSRDVCGPFRANVANEADSKATPCGSCCSSCISHDHSQSKRFCSDHP